MNARRERSVRWRAVSVCASISVGTLIGVSLVACGGGTDDAPSLASSSSTTSSASPTSQNEEATAPSDPPATSAVPTTATTTAAPARPLAGRVIVVDPGHNGANGAHPAEISRPVDAGGFDKACNTTGTAEGAVTESRVNWELAQVVRTQLEAAGATVVLTRNSDDGWGPCIDERGLTAQRAGADVLVSLHADGADAGASGFHAIHPVPGPAVSTATSDASAALAVAVRDELVAEGLAPASYIGGDGVVARSDLGTLNRAGVPAVMLEAGNLHHPGDLALLTSDDGRSRIATAITTALAARLG